ncbi:MAG: hypothetical protein HGA16_02200, partial [Candidatus Moranbacteria bacterium]|nr:hypothetical protein [Candidatus Moranbacteria bacterium]
MKRSEIIFSVVQVPVDYLMIVLAAVSVFLLRDILPQISDMINPKVYSMTFQPFFELSLVVAPLFLITYAIEGLYAIRSMRSFWKESFQVFKATSLGVVVIIIAVFLERDWFSSRFIIVAGWFVVAIYVSFARLLLRRIQRYYLVKKGVGVYRVLLIGGNGRVRRFAKMFTKHPEFGYKAVDIMESASLHRIDVIREEKGIDEIIVCDQSITDDEQEKILDYCQIHNISFKYFPTTLQTSRFAMRVMNGEPLIEFLHTPLDGWGRVLKRIFDVLASAALIAFFSPIMGIVALLIKLEDGSGPIVYKNERVGENGKKFFVYKFRYMKWKYCVTHDNPDFDE